MNKKQTKKNTSDILTQRAAEGTVVPQVSV